MSRFFNGPSVADIITFSAGNAPPDEGPITIAVLARATNLAGSFAAWMVQGRAITTPVWAILVADNSGPKLFMESDFTAGNSGPSLGWCWYVATKASGSSTPRWHVHDLTAGTAWTHVNAGGNVPDGSGPITNILVGGNGSASTTWRGRIAAVAAWNTVLADLSVEAACTLAAADLAAANPNWGVLLNQASTVTAVTDFTGGGGNQTALSGTSVDADEPPGWDYSLSTPSPVPDGIAIPVALGAPATALNLSPAPGGIAIPVTLGNIGLPVVNASGSWWTLKSIADENRLYAEQAREEERRPLSCPNDGEPLDEDASGLLHCRFDGWTSAML